MSDYKVFNDNGEERTWEELYEDNVKLQQETKYLNKKWHKLKRKIKEEISKTYDLTTEDYREERKYIITTYKYVLYIMKELEKVKENE